MINRLMDLRFVIGLFFLVVGLLLFGYSFFAAKIGGAVITVNRWSGVLFVLFGVFMIYLHFRDDSKEKQL